ncbi:4-coumarate-CoA ligase 2 [Pochonia chlamydosporia 170]|uniref:4-coumarate-CoA ligase 2 n=1 Tax=Pochonia chlamydosporia 170 TaxID=1380566 RepID=A0A179EZQ3_METCM|nr:4-coumarate-CoA ligase 2 [Pochonia chlamydosporia 170]OAQ58323.1 4-coumarate-CoA ligase 2 [Pochonia chlamydosporia 170]
MLTIRIPKTLPFIRILPKTLTPQPKLQPQTHFHPLRIFHRPFPFIRLFHHSPKLTINNVRAASAAASQNAKNYEIPARLIIYHAGTPRITFLALLKLTTLILAAFFTLLVLPSYIKAEKPLSDTAALTLCGIIPMLFIAYTTAPFVTHMYIHLPDAARTSPAVLRRFVAAMPAGTQLTLTTMSFIAKPRYSSMRAGDLRPATRGTRMGLVNYVRDTAGENASRKWYMYRAVGRFYIQEKGVGAGERVRYQKKQKMVVDTWIWDAVKERIAKRAASGSS